MRFTIRRLMVLVGITAVVCYGFYLWRLSGYYQARAISHRSARVIREYDSNSDLEAKAWMNPDEWIRYVDEHEATIERWRKAMEAKYERAAHYPWLPVGSDPPEPE
jgi:hypothetical protein